MAESLFELRDVIKKYDERTVLEIPALNLEESTIYALLGPNGSGKSTLLRILNLLEAPTAGKVFFRGIDAARASDSVRLRLRRQMCMVFQHIYMFNTSVYNNVAYGLRLRGLPSQEIGERVEEALSFVGLSEFIQRSAVKLSGGETQRVALARAIAIRPRVLLLDEPTANLDPDSVALIEQLIQKVHRELHTTVLLVTHNLFQARRIAEEALLLYQGKLVEKAPVEEFFNSPQEEITKQFVTGRMIY
jgi:tungstate transport system ATP-binding protein